MTQPTDHPTPEQRSAAPTQRHPRRRWILISLAALAGLVLLLVIFAPTIASTGAVRSFILGKVNDNLNGTVAVDDWSLGWFTGLSAQGVVVRDDAGNEVARLASLRTGLSVWEVVRGAFHLDDVTIDGLQLNLSRDESGELNIARLAKQDSDTTPTDEPARLPDLRGRITITNSGATYIEPGMDQPARFTLAGDVTITDINAPIEHDLQITTQLADGRPGRLYLTGRMPIARDNQIHIDLSQLRQRVRLENIELAAIAGFIPPDVGVSTLTGAASGDVSISGAEQSVDVAATLRTSGFAFGGAILDGDVYRSSALNIELPATTVHLPADGQSFQQARFAIGQGSEGQQLRIALDQGQVLIRGDVRGESLLRLAQNLAPGAPGSAHLSLDLDLGALAEQLPHLLEVKEDLRQIQGHLNAVVELAMTEQQATPRIEVNLRDISALNTRTGQTVRIQPITLTATATSLGGGGAVPDIRNIRIALDTGDGGFAKADIQGPNLGSIRGELTASLDRLQNELSQFVGLGDLRLAGALTTRISTQGDLAQPGSTAVLNVVTTFNNLHIAGLDAIPPIDQQELQLTLIGNLYRGDRGEPMLRRIRGAVATLRTGSAQDPAVDIELAGEIDFRPTAGGVTVEAPNWQVRRFVIDLPKAQRDSSALQQMLADRQIAIPSGRFTLEAHGSYTGNTLSLADLRFTTNELTLATTEGVNIVESLTTTLATAGSIALGDDATRILLSRLELSEPRNYLALRKTSRGDLAITLPAGGGFAAAGQVRADVSLGMIAGIVRALQTDSGDDSALPIRRGFATATLNFDADNGQTRFDTNLAVRNLVLLARGQPLEEQSLELAMAGTATADLSDVRFSNLKLTSPRVSAEFADLRLALADHGDTAPPWAAILSARAVIDVPDAGYAWALMEAFAPPVVPQEGKAPPLQLTAGSLAARIELSQQDGRLRVNVSELTTSDLAFARGDVKHVMQPVRVVANTELRPSEDGTLAGLILDALDVQLGFAQVQAVEPVRISGLEPGMAPDVAGRIRASGELEPTFVLLNALSGSSEPPAYAGRFEITQQFKTQNQTVAAALEATITGLRALAENSAAIEDELRLASQIELDMQAEALTLRELTLAMPKTSAIGLSGGGTIRQFRTDRQLDLRFDLSYDAERLWQVIYPMLSATTRAEMADARIFGTEKQTIVIGGSYPADKPFNEAIRTVTASGAISLKTFQATGWDIRELAVPFKLENGRLQIQHAPQTPGQPYRWTAQLNGGRLNLALIQVDLSSDVLRVTTPENYKLIVDASLNPVLADKWFGRFINPMLANAEQARGRVDVIIVRCENLSLEQFATLGEAGDARISQPRASREGDAFEQWRRGQQPGAQPVVAVTNSGSAHLKISVTDMQLGSPQTQNLFHLNIVNADIKDADVFIENGTIRSNVPVTIDKRATMVFNGAVNPGSSQILDMMLDFPTELLPRQLKEMIGDKGLQRIPFLKVPVTGSVHGANIDLLGAVQQTLLGGDRGLEGLLDLIIRDKDRDRQQQQQPNPQTPQGNEPISQPRR